MNEKTCKVETSVTQKDGGFLVIPFDSDKRLETV